MRWKILISFVVITISCNFALADCPSADLTGNCFVDFEDFALMAAQWLTGDSNIPDDMVYRPYGGFEMGDHFAESYPDELPLHAVLLDAFFMSKFEITNQQYCDYLNSAYPAQIKVDYDEGYGVVYAASDSSNSYPYCDTHSYDSDSQIDYNDVSETFSVREKGGRDMSDDPMVEVSWYGAVAYCNWRSRQEGYQALYDPCDPNWPCDFFKHGYRLPTEAEWEYATRSGLSSKRFPWGDTISHSQANYKSLWVDGSPYYPYDISPTAGFHPTWNDGIRPYTSVVGSFSPNGYGLYDMVGNVLEWCNDWYGSDYYDTSPYDNPTGPTSGTYRVIRGGNWFGNATGCRVAYRYFGGFPSSRGALSGFRIVLDLN
jgi:formylglycine-generating enzyme required for sulfatase activity